MTTDGDASNVDGQEAWDVRWTILVDNLDGPGLATEHGFSLWIESGGKRILFDTGQGNALSANASVLGVDLGETDWIVLSHGHYDHTGGLPTVLEMAGKAEVYCHRGVLSSRYSIRDGQAKPVQLPRESLARLSDLPPSRLHWVDHPVRLSETMGVTGPIPRKTSYEDTGGPFYQDAAGRKPDPIEDDIALWIQTDDGLVITVGCCHAGLVNTLEFIRSLNEGSRIRAIIGGFHLLNADHDRLERTLSALHYLNPDLVIPCHCTGQHAVSVLREAMGNSVLPGGAGMVFRF